MLCGNRLLSVLTVLPFPVASVFVGDALGGVHVFSVGELERGPLALLAAPCLPGGAPAPCRALLALPDASAGGGLVALHGGFLTCYLQGRPVGKPPAPCLVGSAGACVAGLAWDPGARAAVASRFEAGVARHAYLAPALSSGGGGPRSRVWSCFAEAALPAPGVAPPLAPAALRTAAVPGGACSLFAAPDATRNAVALWRAPQPPAGPARGGVPTAPMCWLAAHSDGPVLDVRCDAQAFASGDAAAGCLLLSLSAGELHVHARRN